MIEKRSSTESVIVKYTGWLRLLLALYIIGIIVVSLMPGDLTPVSNQWHMDKIGHFLAYTGLSFLIGLAFSSRNGRFLALLCAIALGFLLEGGQFYVPGREMSLADGIVNTCGILMGMLLFYWRGRAVEHWLSNLRI